MKIVVIHDFNANDRFDRLMKEFTEQGIKYYTILPAIHDNESALKGINLAHKQCVQYAKDNGLKEICIMEDDIKFTSPNSFNHFIQNKPKEFDLYLGGIYLGEILPNNLITSFAGMHCYIIKNHFYDTFLNVPNNQHIDRALSNLGTFYVSYPFTSIQYNGYSYNTKQVMNYDSLLENKLLY